MRAPQLTNFPFLFLLKDEEKAESDPKKEGAAAEKAEEKADVAVPEEKKEAATK